VARLIALHHLCLCDLAPPELVRVAAGQGLRAVTLFVRPPSRTLNLFPLVTPGAVLRDTRAALRAEGVQVHNTEVFSITPRRNVADFAPDLALAADLGAARATVLVNDDDAARATDNLARVCEMAAAHGLSVTLEFMPYAVVRTAAGAAAMVRAVNHPRLGILLDTLHLFRGGEGVAAITPDIAPLITAVQVSDGPLAPPADPFDEAVRNRAVPGAGELPLRDVLARLAPDTPLDIEVPLSDLAAQGVSPEARVQRLVAGMAALCIPN
jgi:sugar phosphate isomerase/epimerase